MGEDKQGRRADLGPGKGQREGQSSHSTKRQTKDCRYDITEEINRLFVEDLRQCMVVYGVNES